jgi:Fe-S cluster assembly protein SufD
VRIALPFPPDNPLPGAPATQADRRAALAELAAAGWPTRRRERWRYTDLEPLAEADYTLAAGAADASLVDAAARALDEAGGVDPARRLVLVDGRRVERLGSSTLGPLEIRAPESQWPSFMADFAARVDPARHPLAALNTAFTENGLWLRVPAGTDVGAPVHIALVGSGRRDVAAQPRIVVDVEKGARIAIVQHFIDASDVPGWTNCVTQIRQAADSDVDVQRFQRHAAARAHTSVLAAEVGAGAKLRVGYFDFGGRLVRNDVDVALTAAGAQAELYGVFLAGAGQHVDNHSLIDHVAGETRSVEEFRGIVGDGGRGVFNGKVIVRPGAQRIDARQSNDNLLLGDRGEIDTKPELEIYANDVKCSHGSTVGELDAEQLFFLRSRGLGPDAAREILTTAFAAVTIERVRDPELRALALELAGARLRSLAEPQP